jgi:cyclopropane fatty-acyl-phospholipid synthase-like methyltransferase
MNKNLKYAYHDNKTSDTGFWSDDQRHTHITSYKLQQKLLKFYKKNNISTIFDFGCGDGSYVKYLRKNDLHAFGIDRNNTKLFNQNFYIDADLSHPLYLKTTAEYCQSFEVGEHIPFNKMDIFIDNICNHSSKGVIISWALEGQGGDGHINEQENNVIIQAFKKRGFTYDKKFYGIFFMYFSDSIMVFQKE